MSEKKPIKAWAVIIGGESGDEFPVFINAPAEIYATRASAYENSNGRTVVQVKISPIQRKRRKSCHRGEA